MSSYCFVFVINLRKALRTGNTRGWAAVITDEPLNHPYSWLRPDIISLNLSIYSLQIFWLTNSILSWKVCSVMPHCVNRQISQVHTLHPLHINDPLNLILLRTRLAFSTICQIIISMMTTEHYGEEWWEAKLYYSNPDPVVRSFKQALFGRIFWSTTIVPEN